MKVRAKAPLRIGFAGGGSDVSPYCDEHGGAVLNATINLYARCFLEPATGNYVSFTAADIDVSETIDLGEGVEVGGRLLLHRAVYLRIMRDFNGGRYEPLELTTSCDAPPGSGLGSSSAVVVCMLVAYRHFFSLPLGEYDLARLAYEIEREDCGLAGGKQDQYAATFGGFNFMEFQRGDKVIINPLRIRRHVINELEASTILFFTGASRQSAEIIKDQVASITKGGPSLEAMHHTVRFAYDFKASLLRGSIKEMAASLSASWRAKKLTSKSISNNHIQKLEKEVISIGATSIKLSGAGGGGFMIIFVEPELKFQVVQGLRNMDGEIINHQFTLEGAMSWTI